MKETRFVNILECLKNEFEIPYKIWGEKRFEVFTGLSELDHRSFLDFETTSDVVRLEIRHLFGNLILDRMTSNKFLEMLERNNGQFETTGSFLSVNIVEGHHFVFLNSYLRFLSKWDDRDIADMIALHFFDIKTTFMNWPQLEYINVFTKR